MNTILTVIIVPIHKEFAEEQNNHTPRYNKPNGKNIYQFCSFPFFLLQSWLKVDCKLDCKEIIYQNSSVFISAKRCDSYIL